MNLKRPLNEVAPKATVYSLNCFIQVQVSCDQVNDFVLKSVSTLQPHQYSYEESYKIFMLNICRT